MRMPPGDNGSHQEPSYFGNFEEAPFFEQVEVTDNGTPISPADDANSTAAEADFSEYMWMEHMEEFDREVMKKLEEEALMEECLNFNAMLEDEKSEPAASGEQPTRGVGGQPSNGQQPPRQDAGTGDAARMLNDLQLGEAGPSAGNNFKLNPLAAEFIPAGKAAGKKLEPKKDT